MDNQQLWQLVRDIVWRQTSLHSIVSNKLDNLFLPTLVTFQSSELVWEYIGMPSRITTQVSLSVLCSGFKGYFTECIHYISGEGNTREKQNVQYNTIIIIQTNRYDDHHALTRIGSITTLVSKLMHISNISFWETSQKQIKCELSHTCLYIVYTVVGVIRNCIIEYHTWVQL